MRELLQIGEAARLVGVSPKTIRYYHEIGLLAEPEHTASGYRLYNAQHLLRLQRIRRLRALGLSLAQIRAILADETADGASTLRAALQALLEEISAQILELEQRRTLLQTLLRSENPELAPSPAENNLFYSPALKAQLATLFAEEGNVTLAWGERLDALLGSFHWPDEYRQTFQTALQHVVEQAEHYQHLLSLETRIASLADLPADAPEVAQLAEEYASSPELPRLFEQLSKAGSWKQGPHATALVELLTATVSPAQRRFFELLAQKQVARPTTPPDNTHTESV